MKKSEACQEVTLECKVCGGNRCKVVVYEGDDCNITTAPELGCIFHDATVTPKWKQTKLKEIK